MYEDRHYVIFSVSEIDKINFNEVLETSADTVRKSVDGTLTFVKWDGDMVPSCVDTLTTKGNILSQTEMISELETSVWTPIPDLRS